MVDHLDDLVVLLHRSAGKNAAVAAYEEENGVSHAEAVAAVETLAEKHGLSRPGWPAKRWAAIGAALLTVAVLGFIVLSK
jgi:hypothetical protein